MTNIPYLDEVWNLTRGCTKVSAGCRSCYADRLNRRFKGKAFDGTVELCDDKMLERPLHWRKPRRVGVCFMSDLFHEKVPDEFLDKVFAVMALTPQHTYVLLTKRPERMRAYLAWRDDKWPRFDGSTETRSRHDEVVEAIANMGLELEDWPDDAFDVWPLPNVWLGVSVENQQAADERIPLLLETPAAHRWLSVEPILSKIDLHGLGSTFGGPLIQWVVVGGESGPKARACEVEWIADIASQCQPPSERLSVPVYVKQDSGPRPGMQGRLPDALWAVKQLPGGWA